jgi:hypothetical protein
LCDDNHPEVAVAPVRKTLGLIAAVLAVGFAVATVSPARAADPTAPAEGAVKEEGTHDAKKKDKDGALSGLTGWLGGEKAQFFRMPVFHLPVIREGRIAAQVSVNVTLETRDARNKNKILENHLKIQSAFLRDLYGLMSLNNGSGRALVVPTVKARLQKVADRVLGPDVVKDILIENVSVRNFN